MELAFANRSLETTCEDPRSAERQLGRASAKKLRSRLADLMAATRLDDVKTGYPHPLKGDRDGQFALRLSGGHRLVFEAADDPVPETAEGAIDWRNVTSIRIVYIGDYHD